MPLGLVPLDTTIKEMKTLRFYKDIICEALVTFSFITAVTQSSMNFGETPAMMTFIKSSVGLYVMSLIDGYGHVNYALFNPNLVIGFVLTKRLSIPKGILYIAVEIFAGAGAAAMVHSFTPSDISAALTPPSAVEGIHVWANWGCELISCNCFLAIVTGGLDENKKPVNIPHLAVGFAVMAATTFGSPYGVCLNPVVSFSLSLITGSWDRVWIYWTAGPLGALIGTLAYYFFAYDFGPCSKTATRQEDNYSMDGNINKGFTDENEIATIASQLRLQELQGNSVNNIRQASPPRTLEKGTNHNNPYKRDY